MKTYRIVCVVLFFLTTAVVSFAQTWHDAASIKKELIQAALQGKIYYSQYNFYDPRKSGELKSVYENVLRCRPQIYGVDFYYASGTWYKPKDIRKARENLIKIVKETWREHRAIASFSWHLENPYVPTGFPRSAGFRYINSKHIPDYPAEHRYVIKEILEGRGGVCGKGNLSGKDNALGYPSPRAWFEERCKEVAAIINEFVDDNGKPIPFIFRLWHEWEGNWMWWGAKYVSAEDYKRFFILTEQTIKQYAPKAQILWAYCSDRFVNNEKEYMERYPGDHYVDVMGFDDYAIGKSDKDWNAAVNRAKMVSRIARKRNMATALFETSNNKQKVPNYYTKHLNRMLKTKGVNLSIVQIWSLKNFNDSIDMKSFVNQRNVIARRVKYE
jgi:mannan endo-1,4-beta-mannosidase